MNIQQNIQTVDTAHSIIDPFLVSLQQHPERLALWVNGRYFSYQELFMLANPIAAWLEKMPNPRCLIFSKRTRAAYLGIVAALLSGKAYVPINPGVPESRNQLAIQLADCNIIIADADEQEALIKMLNTCTNSNFDILLLNTDHLPEWTLEHSQHQFSVLNADVQPTLLQPLKLNRTDDACLLFTSGSTGIPKGVMLSHENILSYISHTILRYQLTETDRVTQMTELTFDFSVQDMFMSWAVGACVYAFPENYFIGLPKYLNEHQITFMTTVPSTVKLLHQLGKLEANSLPYLRQNIFGGEPFSDSAALLWQQAACNTQIDNVCGPTEATIAFLAYPWNKNQLTNQTARDCIPLGWPFPGQSIVIINAQLTPVAPGEIGELCLAGSQVIPHYWRNPALDQERFIELPDENGKPTQWYRTGDIVRWDNKDGIIFKGRIDDQIQIRGCRVEKLEIERVLREVAQTESAAILPWPIGTDGVVEGVVGFVSHTNINSKTISQACRQQLPDYMSPKEIYLIEQLPLNTNGKVDYLQLKQFMMNKSV